MLLLAAVFTLQTAVELEG